MSGSSATTVAEQTSGPSIPSHAHIGGGRSGCGPPRRPGGDVTILQKLFTRKPAQRIRICVECGMPVAEHKEWCSILRTQQEMASAARTPAPSPRT